MVQWFHIENPFEKGGFFIMTRSELRQWERDLKELNQVDLLRFGIWVQYLKMQRQKETASVKGDKRRR